MAAKTQGKNNKATKTLKKVKRLPSVKTLNYGTIKWNP
jgi:hypothetical protein